MSQGEWDAHHSTQKGLAVNALEWCYKYLPENARSLNMIVENRK